MSKTLWRWKPGPRGGGYMKFQLLNLTWPLHADSILFRYAEGVGRSPHRDPMPPKRKDWRHYRLNVILRRSPRGGEFVMHEGKPLFRFWRVVLFRPDLHLHEVTPCEGGPRYVLSVGWSLPPKRDSSAAPTKAA